MTLRLRHQALRFLIAGAINTAATYAIYLALLPLLDYTLAYTIAYVTGIVISYLLSTSFVFRVSRTAANMATFPLVYVVQYLLGVATLLLVVPVALAASHQAGAALLLTAAIVLVHATRAAPARRT